MKTYYISNPEHMEAIYGFEAPVCIDAREIHRLAEEREMIPEILLLQFHKANEAEIAEYGVKDTPLSTREVYNLWIGAVETPNRDVYISDGSLSYVWGDFCDDEIPMERIEYMGSIWDAAHMDLDAFIARSGMSKDEFCNYYAIDYQIYTQWTADASSIPEYVRLMLARGLNII